jgi:hypothetical protein
MSQVSGQGTIWNLPNYAGELFSASIKKTPFLSIMGGLTGGGMQTPNFQFPTASLYDFPTAAQPAITEDASAGAQTGTEYARTQESNVTQIFQEAIDLTYVKNSNTGRLSGINTQGAANNAPSELDFQTARALEKIARDVEYSMINGAYQISTASNVANKTRGMYALLSGTAGEVDASGAALSKDLMQSMFKAMAENNADFNNVILYVDAEKKQLISDIYGYEPTSRTVGGVDIQEIVTDFGNVGVVWDYFNPTAKILAAEMSVVAPVFQPVPGKGNFFREELSKVGAAEKYQIFGQLGLDHGPAFMHGAIIGLA